MFKSNIRELMNKKDKTVRSLRDETGLSVTTIQRACLMTLYINANSVRWRRSRTPWGKDENGCMKRWRAGRERSETFLKGEHKCHQNQA